MSYETDYQKVLTKIEELPNEKMSFPLWAEYGKPNHYFCVEIVKLLDEWDYDYDRDCYDEDYQAPDPPKKIINKYAQNIMDRGGFQALQNNFYAMLHCVAIDKNLKYKVYQLNWIFNGLKDRDGNEWRY
jgi:hypothetical protein